MATQLQPQNMANPNKNVLIVLSPDTKVMLSKNNKSAASHCITPLEFKDLRKSGWVNDDCILRENMVLQLDPIHKRYAELTTSKNDKIIKDRIDSVHLILQQLGAKSVYIKQEIQKGSKKTIDSSVHAALSTLTGGNGSIDGSYNSGQGANYEYVKDTSVEYKGYYTRQSYNKAIELSKEYGWDTDSYIQSILYQRNPDHKNHLDKAEMQFKLREDLQNNMKVAAKLQSNCKGLNVDIDGNWKKDEESTKNEQYHIIVEFGPLVDEKENGITTIHQLPDNLPVLPPPNTNAENDTAFVSDLQKQFESFEGRFGNADMQISVLHDNIDKLETQQNEIKKEHGERIEQLDTSVSSLLKRTDDIEEFAAQIEEWGDAVGTHIENLQTAIKTTNDNLTEAQGKLSARIDNLQSDIETTNSNLTSAKEELNTRINTLQTDIETEDSNLASVKEELTTHIDRLQKEIEIAEINNKSIKRQLIWLACIMAVFCAVTIVTTILVSIAYYEYF